MTAIDFPNSPSVNDTHTVGNRIWKWNGTVWEVVRSSVPYSTGATGPTGNAGPTGPIQTITIVDGLVTSITV
jgi:hypothetical protein